MTILAIMVWALYSPSMHALFIFDDEPKVLDNPEIRNLSNLKNNIVRPYTNKFRFVGRNDPSRPFVYLTFTLNHHWGKFNPWGYHVFNVMVHIFNACLVFGLAHMIFRYVFHKSSLLYAFVCALFFVAHPVQTEVVTYIYHRSGSMATFFTLGSLIFFMKAREQRPWLLLVSLLSFVLAMGCKQIAAAVPLMVVICDAVMGRQRPSLSLGHLMRYHLPFWGIVGAYLAFRCFYLGGLGDVESDALKQWTPFTYFMTQWYVVARYVGILLVPVGLCIDHLVSPFPELSFWKVGAGACVLTAMMIALCILYKKGSRRSNLIVFLVYGLAYAFCQVPVSSPYKMRWRIGVCTSQGLVFICFWDLCTLRCLN